MNKSLIEIQAGYELPLKRKVSLSEDQMRNASESGICADGGRCGLGGHCEHCPNLAHELPEAQSNTSQTNSLVGEIDWISMPDGCVAFVEDTVDPEYSDWVSDNGDFWDSGDMSWSKCIEDEGLIIVHRPPEDMNQSENPLDMVKQERYQDANGEDWIDEFARTSTVEEFRGAMRFTIGKYNRRVGKKDEIIKEIRKMKDYCQRWELYELRVSK
jgi:hypothetical protein